MTKRTSLGLSIEAGLKEAIAHRKGEIELPSRTVPPMTAAKVKGIIRRYAKSPKAFEKRFGLPARTIEGWEQNKAIDAVGRLFLTVLDKEPEAVERALDADAA
jgi:putative transcriptional regulator